jgi:hypothetical protein
MKTMKYVKVKVVEGPRVSPGSPPATSQRR